MSGKPLHTSAITLRFERYTDGYVVICDELATRGYAPSIASAVDEFAENLRYQIDCWERDNGLTPAMDDARRVYRGLTGESD